VEIVGDGLAAVDGDLDAHFLAPGHGIATR
jgi:hypothetical protein